MYKSIHRRQVIKSAIALPFLASALLSCESKNGVGEEKERAQLNILILGGTSFLGPQQIAYALKRGHKVSTFTRGKTKPTIHADLFNQVEMLIGDREDNLSAIEKGEWDLVIDNSGNRSEWTKKTAELLKDRVGIYMYTSSTGVYYPYLEGNIKEDTKLVTEAPKELKYDWEQMEYDFGIMKTKSEFEAIKAFGEDRTIIIRPTYMVGPGDKTDRFIHWPIRLSSGGEVLVPGKKDDPVQYIDVRDVGEFMIRMAEDKAIGKYNVAGPKEEENMRTFVSEASKAFDVESTFVYVDDYKFLEENDVPYLIPWIPPTESNYGSSRVNNEAALAAGLTFRPLTDTLVQTLEWWMSDAVGEEKRNKYESNPKSLLGREMDLIKKWKSL